MSRVRSHCIYRKCSFKNLDDISKSVDEELITITIGKYFTGNYLNNEIRRSSQFIEKIMKIPVFSGNKKEFPSKTQKPLIFHDKVQLVPQVDCHLCDFIEPKEQNINFERYITQFNNEDEIRNLEIQDIIDIDHEKLEEIKHKTLEYINIIGNCIEEKKKSNPENFDGNINSSEVDTECEENLASFFAEKLNDIRQNEINLQIFVSNIEKVKEINYSHQGVKLFFNK